jgi:hypothetical protein
MSLTFVAEVWEVLREHVDFNDRSSAADSLITLLIENNYEPDEIKSSFRGDKDIATALKDYIREHESEPEYEDYEEDDIDNDWD